MQCVCERGTERTRLRGKNTHPLEVRMPATTLLDDDASRKHDKSPRNLRVEKAPFFVDVCELGLLFSLPISAQCTTTNTATTQQESKRIQLSPSPPSPLRCNSCNEIDRHHEEHERRNSAHTHRSALFVLGLSARQR